ncbi:MAG: DMT family transporter [Rhizonema sp. PD38]|nr:DMT family transporter [Rhizonema sp. PD38]
MTNQQELTEQELLITPNVTAFASLFVGLGILSSVAIFITLSEREIGPAATIFNRAWIATVFFVLWNGFSTVHRQLFDDEPVQQEPYTSGILWRFLALGILMFLELFLWAWSLTQTSITNSSVLSHLTPLFTVLAGWLVWRMHFDSRFLTGMVIAVGGSFAIGLSDLQISANNVLGDVAAVVSAIMFGGYLLVVEQLRTKLSAWTILLWGSVLVSLLSLPVALITEDKLFPDSWGGWLSVIALALLCQALGEDAWFAPAVRIYPFAGS